MRRVNLIFIRRNIRPCTLSLPLSPFLSLSPRIINFFFVPSELVFLSFMIISLIDYRGLMILDFLFFSEKLEKFYKYLAIKRYNYFGFRCVLRLLLLVYTCQIYISQFSYPSSHPIRSDPIVYCSGCIVYNTCYNIQDVYIHHHVHPRVRIRKGRDV